MRKLVGTAVAVVMVAGTLAVGVASAGTRADTIVTIKANGGDYYGAVKSSSPRDCAKDRKIVVFRQTGQQQNPREDEKIGSDLASRNGDRFMWSTGNSGMYGKIYARAGRTPDCKADTSRTIETVEP